MVLNGALQGKTMQERPGHFNTNPWRWVRLWQKIVAHWQRPLPSPAPGGAGAEPFMLTSADNRTFFYSFLWDWHCSAMSPTQNQDKVDLTWMAPSGTHPRRAGTHGGISLRNTSCKNTQCHSHTEQRFPSFHYHNWQKSVLKMTLAFYNVSAFCSCWFSRLQKVL